MINYLFAALLVIGFVCAFFFGGTEALSQAATSAAADAVTVCIAMAGGYALWLGLINILREAGVMKKLANGLFKIGGRLFPGVERGSAAAEYISLNLAANMLGIGNAATPFGLSAMRELQELNGSKKVATDAMCMFIIINASSVQLLPLNVITMRTAYGSQMAAAIVLPALIATAFSTAVGILAAKVFAGRRK